MNEDMKLNGEAYEEKKGEETLNPDGASQPSKLKRIELYTCAGCGLMFKNNIESCPRCGTRIGEAPIAPLEGEGEQPSAIPQAAPTSGGFVRPYATPYSPVAQKPKGGSVFSKWWFWTIMAGTLVVIAIIVCCTLLINSAIASEGSENNGAFTLNEVIYDDSYVNVTVKNIDENSSALDYGGYEVTLQFENKTDEIMDVYMHSASINGFSADYMFEGSGGYSYYLSEGPNKNGFVRIEAGEKETESFIIQYDSNYSTFIEYEYIDYDTKADIGMEFSVYKYDDSFGDTYSTESTGTLYIQTPFEKEADHGAELGKTVIGSDDKLRIKFVKKTNDPYSDYNSDDTLLLAVTNYSDKTLCFGGGNAYDSNDGIMTDWAVYCNDAGILSPGETQLISVYRSDEHANPDGMIYFEILYGDYYGLGSTYSSTLIATIDAN